MQPIASYLLHRHSPLCPPAWRWDWAQAFVDSGRRRPRNLDDAALAALRLAHHLRDHGDDHAQGMDKESSCELVALQIYEGNPARRMLVEAWILSGETDAPIGQRLGIEPAVVGHYEML